ncbi:hypothetical protein OG413_05935 [Streptomyces sp. NBC_01433]|uniref:hypothetical protein n=1 Tax=Streptomyces sp. NBC_01433 TaxID=2903864 RepID=UPI0022540FE5|nr:hypothetical protein [Streptomyces sp. NBC_01433]MCX4674869.1 hypothetical protein [Streptomyces sp. NBC_01433]
MKQNDRRDGSHAGVRITARGALAGGLSAALLLTATACTVASGGGAGTGHGLQRGAASSPAAAPGELNAKALKRDSVPGLTVTTPGRSRAPGTKDVGAGPPCRPLARIAAGAAVGSPDDTVVRRVSGGGLVTTVTLASYKEERAVAAMTDLSASADACAEGFTLTVRGAEQNVTRAVRELAPVGTDQAMGFGLTLRTAGKKTTRKVIVFRKGSTIGVLTTVSDGATPPEGIAVPPAVVEAQLAALA